MAVPLHSQRGSQPQVWPSEEAEAEFNRRLAETAQDMQGMLEEAVFSGLRPAKKSSVLRPAKKHPVVTQTIDLGPDDYEVID